MLTNKYPKLYYYVYFARFSEECNTAYKIIKRSIDHLSINDSDDSEFSEESISLKIDLCSRFCDLLRDIRGKFFSSNLIIEKIINILQECPSFAEKYKINDVKKYTPLKEQLDIKIKDFHDRFNEFIGNYNKLSLDIIIYIYNSLILKLSDVLPCLEKYNMHICELNDTMEKFFSLYNEKLIEFYIDI